MSGEIEMKIIITDDLHKNILKYIKNNEIIIGEYDDMKDCILNMIRAYYVFNMDRDRLRDAMEDITYMLCPEDDINKDRVSRGLEYEYSSEEEEEDEEEEHMEHSHSENCCEDGIEDIGNIVEGNIDSELNSSVESN